MNEMERTEWSGSAEGVYHGLMAGNTAPELAHLGLGRNHGLSGETPDTFHEYAYKADGAGFYFAWDSWSGWSSWRPDYLWHEVEGVAVPQCDVAVDLHSQSLNWTAVGGGFTVYGVHGLQTDESSLSITNILANLYIEGFTWAEAYWNAAPHLARHMTPVGDPLARVKIVNPDIAKPGADPNDPPVSGRDRKVDQNDFDLFDEVYEPNQNPAADFNGDEVVNGVDRAFLVAVDDVFPNGRDCDGIEGDEDEVDYYDWHGNVPPPPPPVPPNSWRGMIMTDYVVNENDLEKTLAILGVGACSGKTWPRDPDGNGVWNIFDVAEVLCNWGLILGNVPSTADCVVTQPDLNAIIQQNGCAGDCSADIGSVGTPYPRPIPDGVVNGLDVAAWEYGNGISFPRCMDGPDLAVLDQQHQLESLFESSEWPEGSGNFLTYDCDGNGTLDWCQVCRDELPADCVPFPLPGCATGPNMLWGDRQVTIADVLAVVTRFGVPCPGLPDQCGACDIAPPGGTAKSPLPTCLRPLRVLEEPATMERACP
jgi:hypothetical protein